MMSIADKKIRRVKSRKRTLGELIKETFLRVGKLENQIVDVASVQGPVVKLQRIGSNDPNLVSGKYTVKAPAVTFSGNAPYCYGVLVSEDGVIVVGGAAVDTVKVQGVDILTRADNGDVTISAMNQGTRIISFWGDGSINAWLQPQGDE